MAEVRQTEQKEPTNFSDYLDDSFGKVDIFEEEDIGKVEKKEAKKDEGCVDCPDPNEEEVGCVDCPEGVDWKKTPVLTKENVDASLVDGKWPKLMKVQGQYRYVESPKKFWEHSSMGFDYKEKTTGLKKDREEFDREANDLTKTAKAIEEKIDRLGKFQAGQGEEAKPEKKNSIDEVYERYNIAPELADDQQKRMIEDIHKNEQRMGKFEDRMTEQEKRDAMLLTKEIGTEIGKYVRHYTKEFPLKYIKDADGNNLTGKQVLISLFQKMKQVETLPEGEKPQLHEMVRDSMQEVHNIQGAATSQGGEGNMDEDTVSIPKDISLDKLKEIHPDLYKRFEEAKDQGVAETLEKKNDGAPVLDSVSRQVDITKIDSTEGKNPYQGSRQPVSDAIDKGFEELDMSEEE